MKKALFATTALVATSGVAFADISISGYAEMGVSGGGGGDTQFHGDFHVDFKGSAETDGGLTAGFSARLDKGNSPSEVNGETNWDSETAFVSGAFGTLTLGKTDGGYDWALGEVGMGTAIADNHTGHGGYNGNGGFDSNYGDQVLRYDNTFGDFGFALSIERDNGETTGARDNIAFGVKYTAAMGGVDLGIGFGYAIGSSNNMDGMDAIPDTPAMDASVANGDFLAYARAIHGTTATPIDLDGDTATPAVDVSSIGDDGIPWTSDDYVITDAGVNGITDSSDNTYVLRSTLDHAAVPGTDPVPATSSDQDLFGISLSAAMANGVTLVMNYSDGYQGGMDQSHIGIGIGFSNGPVSVSANYGEYSESNADGFGVAVNYALGGGTTVMAGFNDSDSWSLGLGMSF